MSLHLKSSISQRRLGRSLGLVLALTSIASSCSGSDAAPTESAAEPSSVEPSSTGPTPEPEATQEPVAATAQPTAVPETADRDFAPVAAEIEAFVSERGLTGAGIVVVHREEGELYREYFGEFSEDRISLIASSSKMISAGVLLKLHEDGALDIDMPLRDYIDWADPESDITAAQLMSNSSGLVGLGPDLLYQPYICQWLPTEELESCGEAVLSGPDDDADVIAPDTEFRYGGAQWQVAGAVAEAVSAKTWSELVNEIYVEPCGLDSLGYISLGAVVSGAPGYPTAFGGDPDGLDATENPNIEGGAYITTSDYGELLLMHLRGGLCGETQVLSSDSLDTMHADRIKAAYGGSAWPNTGYGMGWWVDRETGRISDGGAFGTVPWLDLDDGYGVYLVIEDTSQTGGELAERIEDLIHTTVVG
jgi:CubicO group peptidase (beta-lactamase class C family)